MSNRGSGRSKATMVAAALALAALAARPCLAEETVSRAIRVRGSATVKVAPDRARVAVSVVTRGATAKAAVEENARTSKAVLEKLRAAVKPPGEVKTGGYDLQPQYDYRRGDGEAQAPVLVGYVLTNRLSVETADLDGLGALLDAAVASGAGQVDSVGFYLDDDEAVRAQALLEAGRRARTEAETVARGLGVTLGEVLEASTTGESITPMPRFAERAMAMDAVAAAPPTEIVPGSMQVDAGVSVTFAIR